MYCLQTMSGDVCCWKTCIVRINKGGGQNKQKYGLNSGSGNPPPPNTDFG